jgi:hypothetical protein
VKRDDGPNYVGTTDGETVRWGLRRRKFIWDNVDQRWYLYDNRPQRLRRISFGAEAQRARTDPKSRTYRPVSKKDEKKAKAGRSKQKDQYAAQIQRDAQGYATQMINQRRAAGETIDEAYWRPYYEQEYTNAQLMAATDAVPDYIEGSGGRSPSRSPTPPVQQDAVFGGSSM